MVDAMHCLPITQLAEQHDLANTKTWSSVVIHKVNQMGADGEGADFQGLRTQ